MRYKTLRWGIVLIGLGLYLAARGLQEIDDDPDREFLGPGSNWGRGYQAGRLSGLADAADNARLRADLEAEEFTETGTCRGAGLNSRG
jgi:hypothetical protein